jgi:predicted dehydrogenase
MKNSIKTAIIGCGNIADHYATNMAKYPEIDLVGFSDIDTGRAKQFAEKHGGKVYKDISELLADPEIELVVNLTIHHAHASIIEQSLKAGKHVHTEKPLALTSEDARRLVDLAHKTGLRLSSAPSNYMGEAQQTIWEIVRSGKIGTPRLVYAEVNHGRIEAWHPNPEPFYEVGILWDVAVYPLTLITTFFGPVKSVTGFGKVLYPDRKTNEGREFKIKVPDFYLAALELENGVVARLTANFYVDGGKQGGSMEIHGDGGSAFLGDFQQFKTTVESRSYGEAYKTVPYVREAPEDYEFSRGVQDLAQSILADKAHRSTGGHAAHVVDIVAAIIDSCHQEKKIAVQKSSFTAPTPMDWSTA